MQKRVSEMKIVTFTDLYCYFITLFYYILFVFRCSFNNDVLMYIDEGTNKLLKIKKSNQINTAEISYLKFLDYQDVFLKLSKISKMSRYPC
jgi:hypothetical protein